PFPAPYLGVLYRHPHATVPEGGAMNAPVEISRRAISRCHRSATIGMIAACRFSAARSAGSGRGGGRWRWRAARISCTTGSPTCYVLLPVWQAEFGLGYAEIGLLRALYVGAM